MVSCVWLIETIRNMSASFCHRLRPSKELLVKIVHFGAKVVRCGSTHGRRGGRHFELFSENSGDRRTHFSCCAQKALDGLPRSFRSVLRTSSLPDQTLDILARNGKHIHI